MLLRSSSTPMLGSWLPSLSHSEALPEENDSPGEIMMGANCVSLRRTNSNSGSLTSCQGTSQSLLTPGDRPSLGGEVGWWQVDGKANVVWSSTSVRKVQSESDLCNLRGSSASARVAANSLLFNDKCINPSSDGGKEATSKVRKTWPKPLSRQRSLSSIPSVCFGASGLDRQDVIPEEVESASLTSEAGESRASVFDQIGLPSEETALHSLSADASLELVNQGLAPLRSRKVLEVIGGQVGVKERGTPARVVQACNAVAFSARQDRVARANRSSSLLAEREIYSHPNSSSSMQAGGRASESKLVDRGGGDMVSSGGGGRVRPPIVTGGGGGRGDGDGGGGSDLTDLYYQKMLKENPGHPLLLGNYAQYLAEEKLDHLKAEEFFQRAILANPGDGELLGQYAKIIWDVHHDRERATSYFERAVQAAPDDSYVVAAYASFLWDSEEEEDVAEEGSTASNFSSLPTLIPAGPA